MEGALLGVLAGVSVVLLAGLTLALVLVFLRSRAAAAEVTRLSDLLEEYSGLTDARAAEEEAVAAAAAAQAECRARQEDLTQAESRLADVRQDIRLVEEQVELQSYGLYEPRYAFGSAEEYKAKLTEVRAELKAMVKEDRAATCTRAWTVDGSAKEGAKMTKRQIKLMLRAFNGDADAAIAKVTHSNAENMGRRIERSFDAINKLGEPVLTYLEPAYLALKLSELRLHHEYRLKKQEEKEEAREAARQLKEEKAAEREIAKIQKDAEREEAQRARALEKARAELAALHGATLEKQTQQAARLEDAVAKLEAELAEAIDRKAKAISRAQQTRSGWVYVLSNIGSFGDGVYKIGLTRRFDPLERVRELGSASVPFLFDVHCIVFSEDAPALEAALHRRFEAHRVNLVNRRKEYFQVSLEEIRKAMADEHGIVSFVLEPEAEEFYESLAARRARSGEVEAAGA